MRQSLTNWVLYYCYSLSGRHKDWLHGHVGGGVGIECLVFASILIIDSFHEEQQGDSRQSIVAPLFRLFPDQLLIGLLDQCRARGIDMQFEIRRAV